MYTYFPLIRPYNEGGGAGFIAKLPAAVFDGAEAVLTEDDTPLGPWDSIHDNIRQYGGGRYSVWDGHVFFSASDSSDCNNNGRGYAFRVLSPEVRARLDAEAARRDEFERVELPRPFANAGAAAFCAPAPTEALNEEVKSASLLFEDGTVLGPSGVTHQEIRDFGGGRFSIWDGSVFFSSSDASDPNTNKRRYELRIPRVRVIQALQDQLQSAIATDDQKLLELILANNGVNNSIFSNFFRYFEEITRDLHAFSVPLPTTTLEIGCGSRPFLGLRCRAEGWERFIANDLGHINADFDGEFLEKLIAASRLFSSDLSLALERALSTPDRAGRRGVTGLETHGKTRFQDLRIAPESVDLIISTSVMEHVFDIEEAVDVMWKLLRPGGVMRHAIDLRDHLTFWDPLRFLTVSAEEYAKTGAENRLRASDHAKLIAQRGFKIIDASYGIAEAGFEACAKTGRLPGAVQVSDLTDVAPTVSAAMRSTFHPPFDSYDLVDLSVLDVKFLCVKP